jgi:hypothetical protein
MDGERSRAAVDDLTEDDSYVERQREQRAINTPEGPAGHLFAERNHKHATS